MMKSQNSTIQYLILAVGISLLPTQTLAAQQVEAQRYARWAIVASDEVLRSGLSELLMVELSRSGSVQLVERQALQSVLAELELSALTSPDGVSQRLQLGRLLRANALMVINLKHADQNNRRLYVVVCDADLGVRLWEGDFAYPQKMDVTDLSRHCLAIVDEVRQRFAEGVKHIVAVPTFLSEDFQQDFDHLQTHYRDALRNSLTARVGVAVVETEEAGAILGERDNTLSDGLNRPLTSMVRPRYSVTPAKATQQAFVKFELELVHENGQRSQIDHTVGLHNADRWLATDFSERVLHSAETQLPALSPAVQFEILVRHAERFAELGNWDQSISLREAALVLEPQDAAQRSKLIEEYQQRFFPLLEANWHPARFAQPLVPRLRQHALTRVADDYCAALEHLSYLVSNRLISRNEALGLFASHRWYKPHAVGAALPRDPLQFDAFQMACKTQREFIRNIYPLIEGLPTGKRLSLRFANSVGDHLTSITTHVTSDVTFHAYNADSLASLQYWVTHGLAENHPTASNVLGLLSSSNVPKRETPQFEAWQDRLASLRDSDHQLASLYGMFGLGAAQRRHDRLNGALERLLDVAKQQGRGDEAICQTIHLMLKRANTDPSNTPAPIRSRNNLDRLGRMRFTPLEMTIDGDPACELASPIIGMLRCGDCDVYWSKQQIFGMYEAGILNRWHLTDATADHALYWEVSWDGRYVWLHAHGQGILAVTPDGIPVASFKGQTPPYGKGHKLIGISPGRAIMVGSFGESHRAWCGLLEVDQGESGKTSANIFFKAKHVAQKASNDQASDDIQTGFTPLALSRVTRKDGASFVLVERRGMPRLQVDLEALEVSVADDEHDSAGLSTQTDLGFAGPYFVRDGRPLHTLSGVATSPNSKQLLYHNDWLYRPGYIWTRQHAESAQLERLQSRTLPQSYWHLRVGSSAHYGLVAFDPYDSEATVFRVQILGDGKGGDTEKDATEQSGKN